MRLFSESLVIVAALLLASSACSNDEKQNPLPEPPARSVAQYDGVTQHYINLTTRFEEENSKLDPEKAFIVFIGDSLTEGFRLENYLDEPSRVLNRGISGDGITTYPGSPIERGVLHRLGSSVFNTEPEFVFLTIGSNDMYREDETLDELERAYSEIVNQITENENGTLVLTTLPPFGKTFPSYDYARGRAAAFNRFIRTLAAKEELPLLDLANRLADEDGDLRAEWTPDGLHLFPSAYETWAAGVKEVMAEPTAFVPEPAPEKELSKWTKHYLDRVARFREENGALQEGNRYLVFVGDSLTEGFPLKEFFPEKPVLNRGIIADGITWLPNGPEDGGVVQRIESSILGTQPERIFLLIGSNDMPHTDTPLEYFEDGYRRIINTTQKRLPGVPIVLHTLPPTGEKYRKNVIFNPRAIEFNKFIRDLAAEKEFQVVDLYELWKDDQGLLRAELTRDGLHVNREGYEMWAAEVRKVLGDEE